MHPSHLRSWSSAVLTGLLLLAGIRAHAADSIAWNLILPPSPDGSHSGRILVTPAGHWHEGPGYTGQPDAVYHFHPRDEHTGGLGPGVPVRQDGELLGEVTGSTQPAPIDSHVEAAVVAGNWQRVAEAIAAQAEPLTSPIAQFLLGHAFLALNRNNESFLLLWTAGSPAQRQAWVQWTTELTRRRPTSAVARYLHGDALARLQQWEEAIGEFDAALRLKPALFLARNARALVYAVLQRWAKAGTEFTRVTEQAPDFVDGHLSLGTYWVVRRAPEGAQQAFERALKAVPKSFLAQNGHGCAQYGLGHWEQASTAFAEAGQYATLAFVLRNLRVVALAADAVQTTEPETSAFFRPSDFLDWNALRDGTHAQGDLLRAVLGGRPLPATPTPEVLAALNAVLDDPTFYERYKGHFDLTAAAQDLLMLLETTQAARQKHPSALSAEEQAQIRRLNRLLIEFVYPSLVAQHEARMPGMRLIATNGLAQPTPVGGWKERLSNEHLIGATHMMRMQQPLASTVASLGPLVAKAPIPFAGVIGTGITTGGQIWRHHLDNQVRMNDTIVAHRGINPSDLSNPSGVVLDMRRAFIDKGNWQVEAPFGLAYYAPPAAVTTD